MIFVKAIFRFYINSSIHVAFALLSLVVMTFLKFDIDIDVWLLVFVFSACITGYNFVKYAPVAKLHHRSLTQQLKAIQFFSLLSFILLVVCCFFVHLKIIIMSSGLAVLNILYAIPVYNKNLREVPFLKIFIIALIWAVVSVIFPFFYEGRSPVDDDYRLVEFVERFCLVILLMIPFEIRDYPYDKKYLKTLISVFGLAQTKIWALCLIVLLFLMRLYFYQSEDVLFYSLLYFSLAAVIFFSKVNQKPYFASFGVEALPIFWLILKLIFI